MMARRWAEASYLRCVVQNGTTLDTLIGWILFVAGIEPTFSGRSTCSSVTTLTDIILISVLSFFLLLVLE